MGYRAPSSCSASACTSCAAIGNPNRDRNKKSFCCPLLQKTQPHDPWKRNPKQNRINSLLPSLLVVSLSVASCPYCRSLLCLYWGITRYYNKQRIICQRILEPSSSSSSSSSSVFMPRGSSSKRKAADKRMWNSKKKKSNSSSLSGINETAAEALFAEIADPEDASSANMEGM